MFEFVNTFFLILTKILYFSPSEDHFTRKVYNKIPSKASLPSVSNFHKKWNNRRSAKEKHMPQIWHVFILT